MSLVFSEYPAILNDLRRILSEEDPTKWSAEAYEDKVFLTYANPIIIGQLFEATLKKHTSSKYYIFRKDLYLEVSRLNQFIETFVPVGKCGDETETKTFVRFKDDTLENLYRRGKTKTKTHAVIWRAYDNAKDNIASIRIEECFCHCSPKIFTVTLTVFFDKDTVYRAVLTLLGFLDLIDNRANQRLLANYVFDINQHLSRQLGVPDLARIVINFLLVC